MSADPDLATNRLGKLMHRLRAVVGPSPQDFVDLELPRHQLRALLIVTKAGPIAVGRLAEMTEASLASTSSLADRLVRAGYLRRQADPADRRRVLLEPTPVGIETAGRLESRFHERFERVVGAMSDEGRTSLEAGLNDMMRTAERLGLAADHDPHHGGTA